MEQQVYIGLFVAAAAAAWTLAVTRAIKHQNTRNRTYSRYLQPYRFANILNFLCSAMNLRHLNPKTKLINETKTSRFPLAQSIKSIAEVSKIFEVQKTGVVLYVNLLHSLPAS